MKTWLHQPAPKTNIVVGEKTCATTELTTLKELLDREDWRFRKVKKHSVFEKILGLDTCRGRECPRRT
jgi:hypothetical protein